LRIKSYRDLIVWQKAVELTVECYRVSSLLPDTEKFGLITQARRAAVSVAANIAEGHGREHRGDYLHHLSAANGSLMELETHFVIMDRLSLVNRRDVDSVLSRASEVVS
jgi:four helix bundle protein